jgi:hypothetical protein
MDGTPWGGLVRAVPLEFVSFEDGRFEVKVQSEAVETREWCRACCRRIESEIVGFRSSCGWRPPPRRTSPPLLCLPIFLASRSSIASSPNLFCPLSCVVLCLCLSSFQSSPVESSPVASYSAALNSMWSGSPPPKILVPACASHPLRKTRLTLLYRSVLYNRTRVPEMRIAVASGDLQVCVVTFFIWALGRVLFFLAVVRSFVVQLLPIG